MLYLGEERSPRQQDVLDHRDKVLIEQAAEPFTLRVCLPRASSHHGDIIHTLLLRAESYGQAVVCGVLLTLSAGSSFSDSV